MKQDPKISRETIHMCEIKRINGICICSRIINKRDKRDESSRRKSSERVIDCAKVQKE